MATTPAFASSPRIGAASMTTGSTARDGTSASTVLTAGSSGTKINAIRVKATDNPADSTVVLYVHDGSAYWLFDEWDVGDPAAGSGTVATYQEYRTYDDLVLPSGWSLRSNITVTPTSGAVHITAWGADF